MSRIVPAPDALVGKRFDVAVAKMLGISRSKAADLVDSGQARVLGREVARSSTLQAGETVEFDLAEEQAELRKCIARRNVARNQFITSRHAG